MERDKLKKQVASGIILIIIGLSFLLSNYISEKREQTFSAMNLELSELLNNSTNEETNNNPASSETTTNETTNNTDSTLNNTTEATQEPTTPINYETYIGTLEIPKISFNRGFYPKESSLNNVKFNIKILPESAYPDEAQGNVIIIGHSGNYSNSYFGNLYQLVIGDTASITYYNKKYTYKIVNIYTDSKDGIVTIYRDETKTTLTLITCTKDDDTTQTIYILELVNVE